MCGRVHIDPIYEFDVTYVQYPIKPNVPSWIVEYQNSPGKPFNSLTNISLLFYQVDDIAMSYTDIAIEPQAVQLEALRKYYIAKKTCDILLEEYLEWKKKTMDATMSEVSNFLPVIPPNKYLKQHANLSGHSSKVVDIDFSPCLNRLLSVSQDGFGIVWDVMSGLKLQAIPLLHRWVLSCSYSPSGRIVAAAGLENKCSMYPVSIEYLNSLESTESIELSKRSKVFKAQHKAYISLLQFLSESELLTGLGDSLVRLWDVEKRTKIREFTEHSDEISSLQKTPTDVKTNHDFVSSSADGSVRLWDNRQQKSVHSIHISAAEVNTVAQLPDGNCFVSGDELGFCQLYDIRSLCPLESYDIRDQFKNSKDDNSPTLSSPFDFDPKGRILNAPPSPQSSRSSSSKYDIAGVTSIALSKSGRIMYTCYADYGCISWDLFQKKIIEKIGTGHFAHHDRIGQVRVSDDGQGLATASWDSTVKIWTV